MPTFDFRCRKCAKTFEASIAFGAKKYPACPKCKARGAEKLLSKPLGIQFKGGGFYKTDSSSTSAKSSSKKSKPAD